MPSTGNSSAPSGSTPYNPPQYLLANTSLTSEELISQFQGFCNSLRYAENAPELVFERLVGNLKEAFTETLKQERIQHAVAREEWRKEKNALKLQLERLTATNPAGNVSEKRISAGYIYSLAADKVVPTVKAVATADSNRQIYLKFWFAASEKQARVRAAATCTPVPYGVDSGWPESDYLDRSLERGWYDTRMEYVGLDVCQPATITQVVTFKGIHGSPPVVAVWLTGFATTYGTRVCVKATANNITETEFTLQINSGQGSPLMSAGVAWVAFSGVSNTSSSTIRTGSFSTLTPGSPRCSQLSKSGSLSRGLISGDRVLPAISSVDMKVGKNTLLDVSIHRPNAYDQSHSWNMTAGPADTSLYSLRVSYIGIQ